VSDKAYTVIGTNVVIDCGTVEEAIAYERELWANQPYAPATPAPLDVDAPDNANAATTSANATPAPLDVLYGFPKSYTEAEAAAWIAGVRAVTLAPAPLDVERLALALHNTGLNSIGHKPGFHGRYSDHCICHPDAAQIANEYAAITPKDFSTRIYKENRGE